MNKKLILSIAIICVTAAAILADIVIQGSLNKNSGTEYEISVVIRSPQNAYWDAVKLGIDQAALDMNVEISYVTLLEENNSDEQAGALELELQNGAQAIVFAPVRGDEISEIIKKTPGNIPLVTLEVNNAEGNVKACVSADNFLLGQELGKQIRSDMPKGGKLIWVTLENEAALTDERYNGLSEQLSGVDIEKVVVSNQRTVAKHLIKNRMEKENWTHIVALEPSAMLSVVQAINELTYQVGYKDRAVYGADSTPEIAYYLSKNIITKIVAVNTYNIGYLGVKAAVDLIRYKKVQTPASVDFALVDSKNMFTTENQRLLFPFVK